MAFVFPDIDPVIYHFGDTPFKITWYSLSYVVSILLSWAYVKRLNNISYLPPMNPKIIDDLITAIIIGIIVGGRLGYVIFYDLEDNLADPINIFKTWNGGMSFHGGLLGVIIASLIHCKLHKIRFLCVMDLVVCSVPIGLFFGRIANFINGELYGRVTNMPWGVMFPGQSEVRHASQIYEAFTEGIVIFFLMFMLFTHTKIQRYTGMLSGLFFLLYAFFRGLVENYREPDAHIGFIVLNLTMGQLLSLPMILAGISLVIYSIINRVRL